MYIYYFLEENELFNKSQHDFRKNQSTLTQQICHYEKVISLLEQGCIVDTTYLIFLKRLIKMMTILCYSK